LLRFPPPFLMSATFSNHLSFGAGTIGSIVAGVLSELTLTPPHELKQEVLGRTNRLLSSHYILSIIYGTDRIENTTSESSAVACGVVDAGTCLLAVA
jgi:hypothetical protein